MNELSSAEPAIPSMRLAQVLLGDLSYEQLAHAAVDAIPREFDRDARVLGAMLCTVDTSAHTMQALAFTQGPNREAIERALAGRPVRELAGDYRRAANLIERAADQNAVQGGERLGAFFAGVLTGEAADALERALGWRGGLAVPMPVRGRNVGVLVFALAKPVEQVTAEERERLLRVAQFVALSLENARLYEEERRARQELEEAQEQGQIFLSYIAHELKTPLTNILGFAQLAERFVRTAAAMAPEQGARGLNSVQKILDNTRRLQKLVDDLQEAFRIGSGRFTPRPERCDLTALVRQLADEQQVVAERHQITVQAPQEPVVGMWDGERLRQMLTNLLSNAVKYSPGGGPVTVTLRPRRTAVALTVADRGLGVPKADLPALFQPYSRLHRSRAIRGAGLGLYIVKGIVEAHGGSVKAESAGEGKGTTFTIVLPLKAEGT